MLLLSFSAFALTTDSFDFSRYQYNRENTGSAAASVYGYWDSAAAVTPVLISSAFGTTYPPIMADFDEDGIREFVVSDGNTIYFYQITGGLLFIRGQYVVGGTQQGSYSVIYDYTGDGLNELVAIHNNTIYILQFDLTNSPTISQLVESPLPTIPYSSIYCDSEQLVSDDILCWYADNNNSVVEWDLESYVLTDIDSTSNDDESDGNFESSVIIAGQNAQNEIYETSFLFRNLTTGYISGLTFKMNGIVGNPEAAGFVYDFIACPTNAEQLSDNAALTADCDGTVTILQDNMPLSLGLVQYEELDIAYLPFSEPYYIDNTYNYIFSLAYQNHNYTNSDDYWTVYADLNPSSNLYRQRNIPSNATGNNENITVYNWTQSAESDGGVDTSLLALGSITTGNLSMDTLLKFSQTGIINTLGFDIGSITTLKQTDYIYDVYICPTTANSLGYGDLFSECSGSETLIKENFNTSLHLGNTSGYKTFELDTNFLVTASSKYILSFIYKNRTGNISGHMSYNLNIDTFPTNDLYRIFLNESLSVTVPYIPSVYALGLNTTIGDLFFGAVPQVNSTTQTNEDYTMYNTGFSHNLFSVHNALKYQPAFSNLNIDINSYKLGFLAQDSSGREGVYIWDTATKSAYTAFDGDGFKDITTTDSFDKMRGVMFEDKGDGGFFEIITTHFSRVGNWQYGYLEITLANGNYYNRELVSSNSLSTDPEVYMTPPFLTTINGTQYFCAIGAWSSGSNEESGLLCDQDYNPQVTQTYHNITDTLYYSRNGEAINALAVNLNGETNVDNIIAPTGILEFHNGGFRMAHPFGQYGYTVFGDINGDDNIDVCGISNVNAACYYSTLENDPPELLPKQYGGYWTSESIGEPLCINSLLTISAFQCSATQTDCNYNNDIIQDTERLVTNCGQDAAGNPTSETDINLQYSDFGSLGQSIDCIFNKTGQYYITVYLQDNKNPTDLSVFNFEKIPINVIDGTPQVTCSFGNAETSSDRGASSATGNATAADDIDSTIGQITGESWVIKLLFAMLLIGGFVFTAAKTGKNLVIIIAFVISLILSVAFGLVSLWFLLVAATLVILIIILLAMIGYKSGSGD